MYNERENGTFKGGIQLGNVFSGESPTRCKLRMTSFVKASSLLHPVGIPNSIYFNVTGMDQIFCISNKFLGDTDAVGDPVA